MSSIATFHSTSSTSSLNFPKIVPLTELPETAQIILSERPRLINVTHQIPFTCTLIDRTGQASSTGYNGTPALSNGAGSPTNRRSSFAAPRHPAASSPPLDTDTATITLNGVNGLNSGRGREIDGDCILDPRRGHSAMYSGILSLGKDYETVQIGWVGEIADQDGYVVPSKNLTDNHKQNLKEKLWEREKVIPIFLEDSRAAGHYEGYCKTGKIKLLLLCVCMLVFVYEGEESRFIHWAFRIE